MSIRPENRKYYGKTWLKVRRALITARGNICEICGKPPDPGIHLTVHHRDRDPTNNAPSNLLVCCPRHHFQQEALINAGHQYPGQLSLWSKFTNRQPNHRPRSKSTDNLFRKSSARASGPIRTTCTP